MEAIARVRRFNRTVTQRIGALDDAYLARGRPLGQARLLWELSAEGTEVRALRAKLDLDAGYLSRLLRALEADGLVAVEADPADARVRRAKLTEAGETEKSELDSRSDELASSILQPLNATQRERLTDAMAEVERLLTASMVHIGVVDPGSEAARYCLGEYFRELRERFEEGFDPGLGLPAGESEFTLPKGLFLVATLHDVPVGCGGLKFEAEGYGYIKRMWVSPEVRGVGLGRRLLSELERRTAEQGLSVVKLETNRALSEAIGMYRAAGYSEVERFNDEIYGDHFFEKQLG